MLLRPKLEGIWNRQLIEKLDSLTGLPLSGVQWTVASMSDITKYLSVVIFQVTKDVLPFRSPLSPCTRFSTKCIQESWTSLPHMLKGLSVCILLGAGAGKQFLEWWDSLSVICFCFSPTAATAASTGARWVQRRDFAKGWPGSQATGRDTGT